MKPNTTHDRGFVRQLMRGLLDWLGDRTVEQHYSAETLAALLEVSVRTIWNYIEAWETSGGKEGIGPVVKLSHKVVRIPASSANRLLRSRTITLPVHQEQERRVA
jgi:hypothetical protein